MRGRTEDAEFHVAGVADRLTPYGVQALPELDAEAPDPELVERAATLLVVMPRQLRTTVEHLLAPHDPERGRRAIDALVAASLVVEDDTGHLRPVCADA